METPAPAYKPSQWLRYNYGDTQAVSKVVGASFNGSVWQYTVTDPSNPDAYVQITEDGVVEAVA